MGRLWKAASIGLGLLLFVTACYWFLPWKSAPTMTKSIWLPFGYEKIPEETQGLVLKRFLEGDPKEEISLSAFKAEKLEAAYVFATPTEMGKTKLTYIGERKGLPLIYAMESASVLSFSSPYFPVHTYIRGNSLFIETQPAWDFGIIIVGLSSMLIYMVTAAVYGAGVILLSSFKENCLRRTA